MDADQQLNSLLDGYGFVYSVGPSCEVHGQKLDLPLLPGQTVVALAELAELAKL